MKDIKLFWRDPTQWSQFVIFFGIMAIYIANIRNSSRLYESEFWRGRIACPFNVGLRHAHPSDPHQPLCLSLDQSEGLIASGSGLAPLTCQLM